MKTWEIFRSKDAAGVDILGVSGPSGQDICRLSRVASTFETARLIAAAPDLFSALCAVLASEKEYKKAAMDWASAQEDFGRNEPAFKDAQEYHDRCFKQRENAHFMARAALAKANTNFKQ